MATLRISTLIDAPSLVCFDLARSIDLHKKSMSFSNEEAISGTTTGLISEGETVTWRARHFLVTRTLSSKITAMERPFYFRDEMIEGIFASLVHDHFFLERNGKTLMVDFFRYTPPFGTLGRMMDYFFLKRYMSILLERRNQAIKHAAECGTFVNSLTKEP